MWELLSFCFLLMTVQSSYVPPYYEGTPVSAAVAGEAGPDYRGEEVYTLHFTITDTQGEPVQGFIHRSWEEFQTFHTHLHTNLLNFGIPRPEEESTPALHTYIQEVMAHPRIVESDLFSDFLGINWSGRDIGFMENLPEFMKVVIPQLYRAPLFPPEPPVFTSEQDCITAEETPFEVYLYLSAFRAQSHLQEYLGFMDRFLQTYPRFDGPDGPDVDSDVWPPGATTAVAMPDHFNQTFVHFLPGGYLNGHTVRLSFLGKSKFNFLHEDLLREWLVKLHGDKTPTRILDIGTGPGFSAFVLAELFPEAEVVAVDLAAPYIRMARQWQQLRNVSNLQFYQANAESLEWLETESFDLINYAYVLHEMPGENAVRVLNEIYRLLTPGGTMNGFEVPYFHNEAEKAISVAFNTWGHNDWTVEGPKGPEPYMYEYEYTTALTPSLEAMGFASMEVIEYTFFESVFVAVK